MSTSTENKCEILSDLWVDYRTEDTFQDFIEYNDIALPLSFTIANDIVKITPKAEMFVTESFELLLAALGIEDEGFESLEELLGGRID
jgi:hypothetical protein